MNFDKLRDVCDAVSFLLVLFIVVVAIFYFNLQEQDELYRSTRYVEVMP